VRDRTMTLPGILAITLCLALLPSCVPEAGGPPPDPFANLHGPYLGQSLPGLDPQPFAPELLSPYGNVAGVAAAPGGREIVFWTVEPREEGGSPRVTIYLTVERDGGWTTPRVAPFSGEFSDGYPAMHPDGSRIYFQSDRPIDPRESEFQYNIWVADRDRDDWGRAKPIGRPINGPNHTGGASVTRGGTLYFTLMDLENGSSDLYRSELVDGVYREPVRLPDGVNAFRQNTDSYVDPEDRYLVYTAFPGMGHEDNPGALYIAYRGRDGSWSEGMKLDSVMNSGDQPASVTISPDGEYVFFMRITPRPDAPGETEWVVYWVDAAALAPVESPG
jgi:Tol biopolymer transport system component